MFFEISFLNSFMFSSPFLSIGITCNLDLVFSHIICQGTILEWCSNPEIIISSFSFKTFIYPLETILIEWVVPDVKIISSLCLALKYFLIFSLAPSYASVASSLRE